MYINNDCLSIVFNYSTPETLTQTLKISSLDKETKKIVNINLKKNIFIEIYEDIGKY